MPNLENKIPPPIVAVICAAVMWGSSIITPSVEIADSVRIVMAAIVASIGAFFCVAGVVSFRRAKTTVNPLKPETASSLVSSGIYQVSRNPMYVGFALFLVALAVYLSSPLELLGVVAFVLYINRFQIHPEERALSALFGSEFDLYKKSVRKWV